MRLLWATGCDILDVEATQESDYFGFYSPDLEGFTGIGHSVEDCLYKAWFVCRMSSRRGNPRG